MSQAKVAVVTGAGSGIGRATSIAFASKGIQVCVADIDEPSGAETSKIIRGKQAVLILGEVCPKESLPESFGL